MYEWDEFETAQLRACREECEPKKYIDRTTDSDKARLKPMEVTGFV